MGGSSSNPSAEQPGGNYDPLTDTWQPTTVECASIRRIWHSAVSTGSELIVWGGLNIDKYALDTGSRYDPLADTWFAIEYVGAPTWRCRAITIWTGSEMIVWGGNSWESELNSGGRYQP